MPPKTCTPHPALLNQSLLASFIFNLEAVNSEYTLQSHLTTHKSRKSQHFPEFDRGLTPHEDAPSDTLSSSNSFIKESLLPVRGAVLSERCDLKN